MGAVPAVEHRANVLMRMVPCDILLTRDDFLPSRVIRFFTRRLIPKGAEEYSHCEICYEPAYIGPDGLICPPINLSAEAGGVWPMPVNRYAKKTSKRVDVYRLTDLTFEQRDAIIRWCAAFATRRPPYDWLGVLHFAFKRFQHSGDRMFCSETVVTVLRKSGVRIWEGDPPEDITPSELGLALSTRVGALKIISI